MSLRVAPAAPWSRTCSKNAVMKQCAASRRAPGRPVTLLALVLVSLACSMPGSGEAEPSSTGPDTPAARRSAMAAEGPEPRGWVGVVVPREAVELSADRAGRLEEMLVQVGDVVAQDMPVARLDTQEIRQDLRIAEASLRQAEADVARARAEWRDADARHQRRTGAPELVSREDLAGAETDLRRAEAALKAAEAVGTERAAVVEQLRHRLERSVLRTPFSGRVSRRYLDAGSTVVPGQPVVRVATTDALQIRFALSPEEAAGLAPGSEVRVITDGGAPLAAATVLWIAPEIDPTSQRILVEALPAEDSTGLHAGLGVRLLKGAPAAGASGEAGSPS
ncbi:MAG: efflux RND transporter periplasmic adaptor subunit [Thermoanaerobaculia bacterium]